MLPRWPLPRRQVSGSPSDSHLVLRESGLTGEGEQGLPRVGIRNKKGKWSGRDQESGGRSVPSGDFSTWPP